ncbi:FAD-dependent oxidoreductase [Cellulomonas endophytica]|uniref:FAD-dependent oxidoreductase n=1 Tax=Cellulomonas endophytica TaxID=2494735 RepID=UPI001F0C79EA|nr:FAD-dependent oxidoreductase [Cellulomonas endophytica]
MSATTPAGPPAADGAVLRVVVVGHGMAASRLVDEVVARSADGRATRRVRLTVVGDEPYGAYNRVLLSEVVAGKVEVAALALSDGDELRRAGVDVRDGVRAIGLDLPAPVAGAGDGVGTRAGTRAGAAAPATVLLSDGTRLVADRVVLATGAAAHVPALPGLDPEHLPAGVHALRTLDDCREIVAASTNARHALVLGGGVLGVEAGRGLVGRGVPTTVVSTGPHLVDRQLDAAGGAVLARALRRLGLPSLASSGVAAVDVRAGRLVGVRLADGTDRPVDLLVLSCGVRPRTALAAAAGLACRRGVVVDDALVTSHPAVLAVGDCAEHRGAVPGLVAPAWDQARVVADRLTGARPDATYVPQTAVLRVKAAGLDVAAVGETLVDPLEADEGTEVVQLLDAAHGRYVKAVVRGDRVVGAVSIGDPRAAAELTVLVDRGTPAPLDRAVLVLPGARRGTAERADDPTRIPDRATICRCNGVTKGAIVRVWRGGARTVPEIATATRATTGCGTCADAVGGIADWLARQASDPPPADAPGAAGAVAPPPADPAGPATPAVPHEPVSPLEGALR